MDRDKILQLTWLEVVILFWIGLININLCLVLLGIFYPSLMLFLSITWLFLIAIGHRKNFWRIRKIGKMEKAVLVGILLWSLILSIFTVPTIFGGRDEGSFSGTAFLIRKNHRPIDRGKIINTFAQIYGEGKALNFPGFYYQKEGDNFVLKSQFLPAYPAYLANFANPKNPNWLKLANLLPLLIFGLAFYLTLEALTANRKKSVAGLLLLLSLAPMILFYKFTLSEIFFASLLWSSLYFLIKYLRCFKKPNGSEQRLWFYWFIFLPLWPALFTRIEALPVIFFLIIILILTTHQSLQKTSYQAPIFLAIIFSFLSIILFADFFVNVLKSVFYSLPSPGTDMSTMKQTTWLPKNWRDFYLVKVFYTYNLLPLFLFAGGAIYTLYKKRDWFYLLPLFFWSPTLFYLVDANISIDHPWMLRRFVFSILPLAVMYTILFFGENRWQGKKVGSLIVGLLVVVNLFIGYNFLVFRQNDGLLKETKKLAQKFGSDDLVLISREASGSGWSLISAPLRNIYQRQAVYFFNPNDYAKINSSNYDHIYLVADLAELDLYRKITKSALKSEDYVIHNKLILPTKDPLKFPGFVNKKVDGKIFQLK